MGEGRGARGPFCRQKNTFCTNSPYAHLALKKRREVRVAGDEGYYFQEKLYKDPRPRLKKPQTHKKKHEKNAKKQAQ